MELKNVTLSDGEMSYTWKMKILYHFNTLHTKDYDAV